MELIRNENGFIDITSLRPDTEYRAFWIEYEGTKYYFKKRVKIVYNELIAEEIAKDFGIPCAYYDLAIHNGDKGVISKNFINKDDKFIPLREILMDYYKDLVPIDRQNNLEDIWEAIEYKYKDPDIIQKLMDQLVNIFMFDSLIGNIDRHVGNLGIIENGFEINFAPVFDNEKILSASINNGGYALGVDRKDYLFSQRKLGPLDNYLIKFFKISAPEYMEYYKSKLWIISDENIDNVFKRVEDKISAKIDDTIKQTVKNRFKINREMIEDVLEQTNQRKLG